MWLLLLYHGKFWVYKRYTVGWEVILWLSHNLFFAFKISFRASFPTTKSVRSLEICRSILYPPNDFTRKIVRSILTCTFQFRTESECIPRYLAESTLGPAMSSMYIGKWVYSDFWWFTKIYQTCIHLLISSIASFGLLVACSVKMC